MDQFGQRCGVTWDLSAKCRLSNDSHKVTSGPEYFRFAVICPQGCLVHMSAAPSDAEHPGLPMWYFVRLPA